MEEWVGSIWHRFITGQARRDFKHATVHFTQIHNSIGVLYRALGGDLGKKIEAAAPRDYFVRRSFLQKISCSHQQQSLAWQDESSLRLPESLSVLPTKDLNKSLYIWLAALAAHHHEKFQHWGKDNQKLVVKVLDTYPQLANKYIELVDACIKQRTAIEDLPFEDRALEQAILNALRFPRKIVEFPISNMAPQPVFLWLYPSSNIEQLPMETHVSPIKNRPDDKKKLQNFQGSRKKAERKDIKDSKDGLMLFRLENLFSWSEFSQVDRCDDDSDDDDAARVAEDLDTITVTNQQTQSNAKIKMDLDLPSAIEDDTPLGEGILLPEWHYKENKLIPERCLLQPMLPKGAYSQPIPERLKPAAKYIRAQFQQMQNLRQWRRRQQQGEELDLNNWLDFHIESQITPTAESGFYQRLSPHQRNLSCLLLADLSMSTDAYIDNNLRIIDVIKDSMLLFGEALNALGDQFSMYGFSSVKRSHVRFSMIKNFAEKYSNDVKGRIQALKPGFHTRMGAAIRQATSVLAEQQHAQKLLLILTDGKPNDIDHYEGRFGIEDTRAAIKEAKQQGLQPFCITVDQEADEYLPYIFGNDSFIVIKKPSELPKRLPQLYHRLTRAT